MTHAEDFDAHLRRGLATLAREAIPNGAARVVELPTVVPSREPASRRVSARVIAVVAAAVIAIGAALTAAFVLNGANAGRIESARPAWTKVEGFPLLPRAYQTAVFTGREVIVWGGRSDPAGGATPAAGAATSKGPLVSLSDGAAYDVIGGEWRVLPRAPIRARFDAVAAWTGSEMIVTGGQRVGTGPSGGIEFLQDGAAYDPARHRWRRIPDAPGCPAFGAWTGRELVVGGNCANTTRTFVMAAYDPTRNVWTTLPSHAGANQLVAVGGRVFAWSPTSTGAVLDRAARRWSALPTPPAPGRAYRPSSFAVAYGGHLAVAGLLQRASDDPDHASVDVLDLASRSWRHYESTVVTPAMDGFEIAAGGGALLWIDGLSFNWFVGPPSDRTPSWSSVADAPPGPLGASGESVVPIGGRRFFIVGGRLAGTASDPTNRPTPEGAILQLP